MQGVGFRPFVYRHTVALGLAGSVRNDSAGVLIDVEGDDDRIAEPCTGCSSTKPPPLARVDDASPPSGGRRCRPAAGAPGSDIVETRRTAGSAAAAVSVDTATCDDCLAEVDDPSDRRYRYPFTNCTNCGPRYTIVRSVPYDRPATTMAGFAMCPACLAEYDDPADRRFHAQPNACPVCGPALGVASTRSQAFESRTGRRAATPRSTRCSRREDHRRQRHRWLPPRGRRHGRRMPSRELRRRKARDDKPFAVMVAGPGDAAAALVELDDATVQR